MSDLALRGVRKSFGTVEIIKGVDLDIRAGEFVVFVGPSGCGKSTLLRMISGLESVSGGRIAIDGRDVTALAPGARGVAMVFQSYALYPHMTVRENMSFGLRMNGVPRDEVEARVTEAARILQIESLRDRKPRQLSGGQRQRVAIGRAIVRNPKVFLFDEPLSNLDAGLRAQMRVEIAKLHQELGATMVYVTHDQVEAMTLADRIVVLNGGRVEQVGRPLDLYERPANRFVAGFLGQPTMNFVPATLRGGPAERLALVLADGARIAASVRPDVALATGARLMVGVRPDAVHIVAPGNGTIDGRVEVVERLGDETVAHIRTAVAADLVVVKLDRRSDLRSGEHCGLAWDEEQIHVFGDAGEQLRF